MQVPLTVCFQEMPVDESMRSACSEEAERLGRYFDRITSCHVTVATDTRKHLDTHVAIHVRLEVPGGEIVASRSATAHTASEKPDLVIREAFDGARRQLQDHLRKMRGDTEHHAEPAKQLERGDVCNAAEDGFRGPPQGERLYLHERTGPASPPGDGADVE